MKYNNLLQSIASSREACSRKKNHHLLPPIFKSSLDWKHRGGDHTITRSTWL